MQANAYGKSFFVFYCFTVNSVLNMAQYKTDDNLDFEFKSYFRKLDEESYLDLTGLLVGGRRGGGGGEGARLLES